MKVLYISILLICLFSMAQNAFGNQVVGGVTQHDANDPEVHNHVKKLIEDSNAKSNEEPQSLVRVIDVSKQIVAGVKYIVNFETEGTQSNALFTCHAEFVIQKWRSEEPQMLDYKCIPKSE